MPFSFLRVVHCSGSDQSTYLNIPIHKKGYEIIYIKWYMERNIFTANSLFFSHRVFVQIITYLTSYQANDLCTCTYIFTLWSCYIKVKTESHASQVLPCDTSLGSSYTPTHLLFRYSSLYRTEPRLGLSPFQNVPCLMNFLYHFIMSD